MHENVRQTPLLDQFKMWNDELKDMRALRGRILQLQRTPRRRAQLAKILLRMDCARSELRRLRLAGVVAGPAALPQAMQKAHKTKKTELEIRVASMDLKEQCEFWVQERRAALQAASDRRYRLAVRHILLWGFKGHLDLVREDIRWCFQLIHYWRQLPKVCTDPSPPEYRKMMLKTLERRLAKFQNEKALINAAE